MNNKPRQLFLYVVALFLIGLLGMCYLVLRNTPRHIAMFQDAPNNTPSPVLESLNTANTFVRQGEFHRAIKHLEGLASETLNGKQTQSLYLLMAHANQQLGLYHTALGYARKANAVEESALATLIEANVQRRRNQTNDAVRTYGRLVRKFPTMLAGYEHLGNLYFAQANYKKALEAFRAFGNSSQTPSKPMVLKQAICLRLLGDREASSELIQRSLLRFRTAPYKSATHLTMALNLKDSGEPTEAKPYFDLAIETSKRQDRPLLSYLQALNTLSEGKTNEAIGLLINNSFRRHPEKAKPLNKTLGLLYLLNKDYERAESPLSKVAPFDIEAAYHQAVSVYLSGDHKKAVELFDAFKARHSTKDDYAYSAVLLGAVSHAKLGYATVWPSMLQEAIAEFDPPRQAVLTMAWLYMEHLPEQFQSQMKPYLPDFPELKFLFAEHLRSERKWDKSLEHLLELSQLHPEDVRITKQIADLHVQTKRYSEAYFGYKSLLGQGLGERARWEVANNMSTCIAMGGRPRLALNFLRKEFKKLHKPSSRDGVAFQYNMSLLSKAMDEPVAFRSHLQKALEGLGDDIEASLRSSVLLEAAQEAFGQGKSAQAVGYLRRLLLEDPGNSKASYLLRVQPQEHL